MMVSEWTNHCFLYLCTITICACGMVVKPEVPLKEPLKEVSLERAHTPEQAKLVLLDVSCV